ncbi:MAG: hypothetical protein GXP32_07360, partial [Kiritimatiellaeota bacterium]|nr:hypothetical protein [Kiritimatiellota bacterium]
QAMAADTRAKASSWTGPMMLLGGGIGVAGIGSAFASVMTALKGEGVLLKIGLFVVGIVVVVATPIVIAAVLKLRHRNIAMILEACGWSINASMRMNRRLGLLFTREPAYPRNSRRTFFDQTKHYLGELDVERRRSCWIRILIITAVLALSIVLGTLARGCLRIDDKVGKVISGAPPKARVETSKVERKKNAKK